MTSMPASRRARAMIFAPRSCPSRPGLATTTRIFLFVAVDMSGCAARRDDAGMGRARLSALDGSFLRVETPTAHMHVGWKGIFEPRAGTGVSVEELRRAIAGRLRHAPRF